MRALHACFEPYHSGPGRARQARRIGAYASHEYVFREFDELESLAGQMWQDTDGVEWPVYVRTEMLIVDYIDFAQASGVLQNQACPECEAPSGSFHITSQRWPRRTARSASQRVQDAHAQGGSAAAIQRRCQSFGL